jgi:SAM-dependent methyltransferase
MVSREDVLAAYRLILGREPESEMIVQSHMHSNDLIELRSVFLHSPEFRRVFENPLWLFPGFIDRAAPIRVDVQTDQETLHRLLRRVERCWTRLGQTKPHWSVASVDQYKPENFAQNSNAFYASGEADILRLFAWLDRNGVKWSEFDSCLELGCGTGRVTPWLARRFPNLTATDISLPHMELAASEIRRQGLGNVQFVHILCLETLDTLPMADVVFSVIVLQHNPPPVIYAMLDRMLQRLRPGGAAFFQVPTYGEGYQFDIHAYLRRPDDPGFDMHVLPQRYVFCLAKANNCSVLEIEPDQCAATAGWMSNTFLVQKRH